jgi:flagellar hook-basal body complex protein FliE
MAPIDQVVSGAISVPGIPSTAKADKPAAAGFGEALAALVNGAENASTSANDAVAGMLDKSTDVHDAMIALQRAEMSLQLTVQIRNKLVQAYNDIMRMSI